MSIMDNANDEKNLTMSDEDFKNYLFSGKPEDFEKAMKHLDDLCGIEFEIIKEYKDKLDESFLPVRETEHSAGYDLKAAEDTVCKSIFNINKKINEYYEAPTDCFWDNPITLDQAGEVFKTMGERATIVPTGLKAKFPEDVKCGIYSRSSMPYKYFLIIGNGVGTIDSDYYNNPDNEGHIGVMLINLSPFDILIKKGERIAQAIFEPYYTVTNDVPSSKKRSGGYGSTDK